MKMNLYFNYTKQVIHNANFALCITSKTARMNMQPPKNPPTQARARRGVGGNSAGARANRIVSSPPARILGGGMNSGKIQPFRL